MRELSKRPNRKKRGKKPSRRTVRDSQKPELVPLPDTRPRRVSASSRNCFKECRRRWKYDYVWKLKPKFKPLPMTVGIAGHKALEQWYKDVQNPKLFMKRAVRIKRAIARAEGVFIAIVRDPDNDYTKEQLTELQELRELLVKVLLHYFDFWEGKDVTPDRIVGIEKKYTVKIPGTNQWLTGVIDLIIRDRRGRLWLEDHKFVGSFTGVDALYLDDQMTNYLWLYFEAEGELPAGAIYNQIRKKIPGQPKLLKDGTAMSRANIDTTWTIYREALVEAGFDPSEYQEMKQKLEQARYFARDPIYRTPHELENFGTQLAAESREMATKKTILYPFPTYDCVWRCPYTLLCKCESEGGDVPNLVQATYERRP